MILAALKAKLRERGVIGFAADAVGVSLGYGYIVALALYVGSGASTAVAIASELLFDRRHRCGAGCATDQTSCRNTEEEGS